MLNIILVSRKGKFMDKHAQAMYALVQKHYRQMEGSFDVYLRDDIPSQKLSNAINSYASSAKRDSVLMLNDATMFGSAKQGVLITDTKLYTYDLMESKKVLTFSRMKSIEYNTYLDITMRDGSIFTLDAPYLEKWALLAFLREVIDLYQQEQRESRLSSNVNVNLSTTSTSRVYTQGLSNRDTANNMYFHDKYANASGGHGFAAEDGNMLHDQISEAMNGRFGSVSDTSRNLDSNGRIVKNGADRIVNGQAIQTKYYRTANESIRAGFENGKYKYIDANGKAMQLEVPKDQYEDAVRIMEDNIRYGKIPNETDPKRATEIIRQGSYTRQQAINLTKAGNIDSLTYDATNGVITASSSFGISAGITFATHIWNGEDVNIALQSAVYDGLKSGGVAFISSTVASQLSKAGLNAALGGMSDAVVQMIGPEGSAALVNAFRTGGNIYGGAAMNSASKLIRGNLIVSGVTVVVLSAGDVFSLFNGRISGEQLFKNITTTGASVAGGAAGFAAGAAIGSVVPGIGTLVGGIVGSVIGGSASGSTTNFILDQFIEDDAKRMISIIQDQFLELANEYLFSQDDADTIVDDLHAKLTPNILKDMFSSGNKIEFARDLMEPLFIEHAELRKYVVINDQQLLNEMKYLLN